MDGEMEALEVKGGGGGVYVFVSQKGAVFCSWI